MSSAQSPTRENLVETRGFHRALDAYVVQIAFDRGGAFVSFGLGDGSVHFAPVTDAEAAWTSALVHEGAVLGLAADVLPGAVITGGDDGDFRRVKPDGEAVTLADLGSKWVDHVATFAPGRGRDKDVPILACTAGKQVHLFDARGQKLKVLEHPSTVTGISFDNRGKRIAASHYSGASLWFVAAKTDAPRRLEWKGSHIGVALHPDGESVVTSMQENALHGWRLTDSQHMRMSGYPTKPESISFSRSGRWLASSGADTIVVWPFFGGGPMGKPPVELGGGANVIVSRVLFNPRSDMVAAGFADGRVVLADIESQRILPVAAPGNGAVTALAWNDSGSHLAFGTEHGYAGVVDLSKR
ncbi:WD40 repeat domain-containing protein [Acidisoma cellulosilytica]|uniref:WD40 repeat domain-containing protein n=1 Tax=Acidisoma cellulosilyticum TaxID=2802395 RepID=A0A964E3Z6_9PROT|nr:WD40 repeat domain-containing protein [Acidisoma cellulosilyticum]MCB8880921.1 WD40 repeat domain-containing protein [Acidisoma cellulosilyticum]